MAKSKTRQNSKNSKQNKKKSRQVQPAVTQSLSSGSRINNEIKLTDYLALAPGFLMVGMIVLVLILDLFTTTMAETQYYDFHNIFRIFDYTARPV